MCIGNLLLGQAFTINVHGSENMKYDNAFEQTAHNTHIYLYTHLRHMYLLV
jgi:hypothetical protein